jgi:hypothetical protein
VSSGLAGPAAVTELVCSRLARTAVLSPVTNVPSTGSSGLLRTRPGDAITSATRLNVSWKPCEIFRDGSSREYLERPCRAGRDRNCWGEVMGGAKILIYLEDHEEDEETDLTGEIDIPRMGDITYRKDKTWKITGV